MTASEPSYRAHLPVVARTASDGERPRLWQIMTELWPNYDAYQAPPR
jgi:hypothetical protein